MYDKILHFLKSFKNIICYQLQLLSVPFLFCVFIKYDRMILNMFSDLFQFMLVFISTSI